MKCVVLDRRLGFRAYTVEERLKSPLKAEEGTVSGVLIPVRSYAATVTLLDCAYLILRLVLMQQGWPHGSPG